MYRTGIGFDVHAFISRRKLILGGVEIPYKKGLKGHSDADVLIHSVMDAVLGAAALGDIGVHFPDSDKKYKDISSLLLLKEVYKKIKKKYKVVNVDAVIIMEEPKVMKYSDAMKKNIARALSIKKNAVNIKATTTEGLGFTGKKEGAACQCAVTLKKI